MFAGGEIGQPGRRLRPDQNDAGRRPGGRRGPQRQIAPIRLEDQANGTGGLRGKHAGRPPQRIGEKRFDAEPRERVGELRQGGRRTAHQHDAPHAPGLLGRQPFIGQRSDSHVEAKGAPLPQRAVHRDGAILHLHQPAGDGEAEAGAAEAVQDAGIRLGEILEDVHLVLGRDADARIGDLHFEPQGAIFPGRAIHRHRHPARLGELHGIAHQVHQDLVEMLAAAAEVERGAGGNVDVEAQAPFAHLALHQPTHIDEQGDEVERLVRHGHAPGLDPRQIEQAVDERLERAAGHIHRLDHLPLLRAQRRGAQEAGHADNGGERGAQLVAHTGEEEALGLARLLGGLHGVGELADQRSGISGQDDEPHQETHREMPAVVPEGCRKHDEREARRRHRDGDHQPRQAEAETIAEDDPQIDGKKQRGDLAPQMQLPGEEAAIQHQGEQPPASRHAGKQQDVAEHPQSQRDVERHHHQRAAQIAAAPVHEKHDDDDEREDEPVEAHLVLAIGPVPQPRGRPLEGGGQGLERPRRGPHARSPTGSAQSQRAPCHARSARLRRRRPESAG